MLPGFLKSFCFRMVQNSSLRTTAALGHASSLFTPAFPMFFLLGIEASSLALQCIVCCFKTAPLVLRTLFLSALKVFRVPLAFGSSNASVQEYAAHAAKDGRVYHMLGASSLFSGLHAAVDAPAAGVLCPRYRVHES